VTHSTNTAKRIAQSLAGWLNRLRLASPRHCFEGTGGIGDELLCSTALHEWRTRRAQGIVIDSHHPALWSGSPEVDAVIFNRNNRYRRWLREGLSFARLDYAGYDPATDADEPPAQHILATMCRRAGLTGKVNLRPYVFLSPEELAAGRLGENQIAIQSSGRSAAHFMRNKEWFPERFLEVCDQLCPGHTVVQIGSASDPLLAGARDLRGQTSLRESAAILANSQVFIGLVGFLMHLARAVDCRGVIVFGGREKPWQTGYIANRNLTGETPCSPCWLRNRCDFGHECMNLITAPAVLAATEEQLHKVGQPLEVETAEL